MNIVYNIIIYSYIYNIYCAIRCEGYLVSHSRRLQQLWQLPVLVSCSEDKDTTLYTYIYNINVETSGQRNSRNSIIILYTAGYSDEIRHRYGHNISMDNSAVQQCRIGGGGGS